MRLDLQIWKIKPTRHVYGRSHVSRSIIVDVITYISNAFGYPREQRIAAKKLLCVFQDGKIHTPC